jgi:hypothetical protein
MFHLCSVRNRTKPENGEEDEKRRHVGVCTMMTSEMTQSVYSKSFYVDDIMKFKFQ